jgi:phosphotransferase system enzyme I (PtsP)
MIASGELSSIAKPGAEPAARHSLHKTGAVLSDGIALGHVVLHEPRVVITNYIAEDLPKEVKRLDTAILKLRADLDRMLERGDVADGGEHRDVLEAYRMFANDQGWQHKLHEAVATGLTAEAAVERVQSDTRARMLRSTDPYLRDRLHDLEDLGHRLMRQLVGQDHAPSREQLPDNAILIARSMGPAALLDYDRKRLRGLVLEEGTANSHVSIVARALGIPAVGEVPNAAGIADPGDAIIVDGTSGSIYIRPSQEIQSAYAERVRFRARRQEQYRELRDKPCVTKDGQAIDLMINAGLVIDLPHIDDTGSSGIGLFRTELQFMVGQSLPRTSEQLSLYRTVLDAAGDKPVTFRTLDIGGDKALPYMDTIVEENPALGWRAIRLGLDRPGLLRGQIRALLRAASGRYLRVMFPMISQVDEFDQAKLVIERELTYLRQHGHTLPERVDVGTMVEVPALLYQMDELLKRVDFISVGSNDLFQFLFAVDRGNSRVTDRFDTLSAPILRALRDIVKKANAAGKSVSLCGEMASQPLGALALIALGYRSLSLSATAHGPVKALILDLDAKKAEAMITPLLDAPAGSVSIRSKLMEFAEAEGLSL